MNSSLKYKLEISNTTVYGLGYFKLHDKEIFFKAKIAYLFCYLGNWGEFNLTIKTFKATYLKLNLEFQKNKFFIEKKDFLWSLTWYQILNKASINCSFDRF
ncbi:hypothetical protein BpHYR1_003879 [Brachionus plicatilis]|uniref:Uncharacterized protein n=1 Tax=Brachionus plicatilis TaxID=10195 RepID=A0A3M7Q5S2_BRAPC|nr:hypothetical protein BpHYR1_003879 [Brachionus plicatilis]